jgi:2-aminoethylphosphonate-pyruvate transaminase
MRIELVVFDMAGTTVYDGDAVNRSLSEALASVGASASRDAINEVMGMPKPLALAALLSRHGGRAIGPSDPEAVEAYAAFQDRMLSYYREDPEVREIEGAGMVFDRLQRGGVKVVLDTGFARPIADAIVDRLGWRNSGLVDAVVTSDEVGRGRPHPDMVFRAMALTGVRDGARVAKVGDTPSDLQEGAAAGCGMVVGVVEGSHTREELEHHCHTHLIGTVRELPALVLDRRLFTPGPLTTSITVKRAMLRDLGTRDGEFVALVREIRRRLVDLTLPADDRGTATGAAGVGAHERRRECVLMQGSGTFGVESVLGSAVPRDGRVLVCSNGAYGERMIRIADVLGIPVTALRTAEDEPASPDEVRRALEHDPGLTHVAVVHCETTTGILNPIEAIGPVVREAGRTFIVDAMSSFGGIPIAFDTCGPDFLISSANKCVEGVPGFSFILCGAEGLAACEGNARSLSLDLFDQWKGLESDEGQFRFTPPVHTLLAFNRALDELAAEGGVAGRHRRYCENNRALMEGMEALGFRAFLRPEVQSPIIATFHSPADPGFDFDAFYARIGEKGYTIYAGKLSKVATFRIGTIGRLDRHDVGGLLAAIRETLAEMGIALAGA